MLTLDLVRFLLICVLCRCCVGVFKISPDGYYFKSEYYELQREENGTFVNKDKPVLHVKGYYKQLTPSSTGIKFDTYYYAADENGFRITNHSQESVFSAPPPSRGISGAGVATLVGGGLG